jgi:signal transduction histidine kinase
METASELRRLTRGALAEMRTLLLELRPSGITNMPLGELLAQLIESVTSRTDLSFELNVENIPPLAPEIQIAFYRIAQESINNVVKHAQASKITLSLIAIPLIAARTIEGWTGEIAMRITDDGVGFRPGDPFVENLGLGIMRERAAAIDANYELESQPGEGTEVTLVWHCPEVN